MADQNEQLRAGLAKEVKEWADIQWPKGKRIGSKGWVDGLVNRVMYQIGLAYPKTPEDVAGEAYQVIGALSHVAVLEDNPDVEEALDHFSTGAAGDILPWGSRLPDCASTPPLVRDGILREVLFEIASLPPTDIYYRGVGREDVYKVILERLSEDLHTVPPTIHDALHAIAALPASGCEQDNGREDAYRAVERMLERQPMIVSLDHRVEYHHETLTKGMVPGEPIYDGQQEYVRRQDYDGLLRLAQQLNNELKALKRASEGA